jgi:acetyl-CoA acetyltransferase
MMIGQFETPFGPPGAIGAYAMACARHMHLYGTTETDLAEIAVAARHWAQMNPRAFARDRLTIEDVLASPMVSWPFKRFDCCLVTDAAGAVVMTTLDRARDLRCHPIRILGWGEGHDHWIISQMPELTSGPGRISGPNALAMAGITHDDIDVAQIYDSFTYTVLTSLEDLGFCKKGEGGQFVSDGRFAARRIAAVEHEWRRPVVYSSRACSAYLRSSSASGSCGPIMPGREQGRCLTPRSV